MKLTHVIIALAIILPQFGFQENTAKERFISDLKNAESKMAKQKKIAVSFNYKLYKNHKSSSIYEQLAGYYNKSNKMVHSYTLGIETIQTANLKLVIDTSSNLMVISNPDEAALNHSSGLSFEDAFELIDQVTEQDGQYQLTLKKGNTMDIEMMKVSFNKTTQFIDKLTIYFATPQSFNQNDKTELKEKPRVEISYSNIDVTPRFKNDEFDMGRFIKKSGSKYVPATNYKNYEVINQQY